MNNRIVLKISTFVLTLALLCSLTLAAEAGTKSALDPGNALIKKMWDSWNAPFKPFRIVGNVYYVGATGVSSYLITTPEGNILIDTGFETTVPRIQESVAKLGFRMEDIKIILSSHAHLDHVGGHAAMKKLTGAKILISKADAEVLASGGLSDFTPYTMSMKAYPAVKADHILADEEKVTLGRTTLTCHLTPGHTKGCTTWTMDVTENGTVHHVMFFGSTSVLSEVKLVNNPKYPEIAEDYAHSFKKLKTLPCDVFLAPHGTFFDLSEKAEQLAAGKQPNPFMDAQLARKVIETSEKEFLAKLKQEQLQAATHSEVDGVAF